VVSVTVQQIFRRVRSFCFQDLVLSVCSEYIKRIYTIRFDRTQRIELSTLAPYREL
jgi:hypothetical protein